VKTEPPEPLSWDTYLDTAWNPKVPTMREVINQVLTSQEQDQYAGHFRPLVEQGHGNRRMASSHLLAVKGD
jgi:hypothetical protein